MNHLHIEFEANKIKDSNEVHQRIPSNSTVRYVNDRGGSISYPFAVFFHESPSMQYYLFMNPNVFWLSVCEKAISDPP